MVELPLFGKRSSKQAGLPPGFLVHIGEKRVDKVTIKVIEFTEGKLKESTLSKASDCCQYKNKDTVTWINIIGLHDVDVISRIGSNFGFHPLLMEDILNTEQRPKVEDYEDHLFAVLKMLDYDPKKKALAIEQVSLVLLPGTVITFQETTGDVFDAVRDRIRKSKGRVRKKGSDYLFYALIDAVVDNYFVVLEQIGNRLEGMEDQLIKNPKPESLQKIHHLKKEATILRRSVWPLREVIHNLSRGESELISPDTLPYFRDLYDHTIQVMDNVETLRDTIGGLTDLYLSSISNRMNEVMKVLTIIATIFIPLTFIAGIYGMNFNPERSPLNMPELNFYFGYPFAIGAMVAVFVIMLIYFRKKKWL